MTSDLATRLAARGPGGQIISDDEVKRLLRTWVNLGLKGIRGAEANVADLRAELARRGLTQ